MSIVELDLAKMEKMVGVSLKQSMRDCPLNEWEAKFWAQVEERSQKGEPFDAHRMRAAYELGIPEADVTAEQRRAAKQMNYYRMYTCDWSSTQS